MTETRHDPYAAWRFPDCRLLLGGSLLGAIGRRMLSVAIGWEIYERTQSAMALAWVGLVQAMPIILLAVPAGHVADRFNRRLVVLWTQIVLTLTSVGLAWLSWKSGPVAGMYGLLLAASITQAFKGAAAAALLPQTVPEAEFGNAIMWKSSTFQVASVAGPALGGLMIGWLGGAAYVYAADAILGIVYAITAILMRTQKPDVPAEDVTLHNLLAGFHFVWRTKVILATLTLDLFAVILGGATILLPIYARDILHVGPAGLGWLRAAPAVGAFLMATALAHLPPMKRSGVAMLWGVAGFALATIFFGISTNFWLSLLLFGLTGAFDNISVVVRHSLVQLLTPDAMRGRVSAVNNLFISSSNELGDFLSGVVAAALGAVASVVLGGLGALVVVGFTAVFWPEVRRLKSLRDMAPPG